MKSSASGRRARNAAPLPGGTLNARSPIGLGRGAKGRARRGGAAASGAGPRQGGKNPPLRGAPSAGSPIDSGGSGRPVEDPFARGGPVGVAIDRRRPSGVRDAPATWPQPGSRPRRPHEAADPSRLGRPGKKARSAGAVARACTRTRVRARARAEERRRDHDGSSAPGRSATAGGTDPATPNPRRPTPDARRGAPAPSRDAPAGAPTAIGVAPGSPAPLLRAGGRTVARAACPRRAGAAFRSSGSAPRARESMQRWMPDVRPRGLHGRTSANRARRPGAGSAGIAPPRYPPRSLLGGSDGPSVGRTGTTLAVPVPTRAIRAVARGGRPRQRRGNGRDNDGRATI